MSKVSKTAGVRVPSTSGGGAARRPAKQALSARTDRQQASGHLRILDASAGRQDAVLPVARAVTTRDKALSFIAKSQTPRGRWLGIDHFDPEIGADSDGAIDGLKAMAQLLGYVATERPSSTRVRVREILMDAGKKADFRGMPVNTAALSFIEAAADLLVFSIQHADWKKYLADRIEAKSKDRQFVENLVAQRTQEFVRRMAAGKAAKVRAAALLRTLATGSADIATRAASSVQTSAGAQQ